MSHDALFKKSLENPIIAQDFFAAHLPAEILKQIDLTTLTIENGSYIDNEYQRNSSDMLFGVEIAKQPGFIYLLVEHQSRADITMPLRMLEYVTRILRQHMDVKTGKLSLVIPLVYYHGTTSPYPGITDIHDCFAEPELARKYLLKPFQLIDLTIMEDSVIAQHRHAALMETLHKHVLIRNLKQALEMMEKGPAAVLIRCMLNAGEYQNFVIKYIYYETDSEDEEKESLTSLLIRLFPESEEQIMTLGQQYALEGKQQGIQEGLEKGLEKKAYQIACKMLKDGMDKKKIAELTDLSEEQIEKIEQVELI